jgi:hypothetical protein
MNGIMEVTLHRYLLDRSQDAAGMMEAFISGRGSMRNGSMSTPSVSQIRRQAELCYLLFLRRALAAMTDENP